MAFPTTNNTETDLSSVNSILGAIGQAPVSRLCHESPDGELTFINPEIAFVYQILQEVNTDVQNEGWTFNRESHYPIQTDSNQEIVVPENMLRIDLYEGQVYRWRDTTVRNGKLYNKQTHSFKFENDTYSCDITWKFPFEELPSVFQRYITLRASARAATQLVANPQLVELLSIQEQQARSSCLEYECDMGDWSYFGTPDSAAYRPFQPFKALARW